MSSGPWHAQVDEVGRLVLPPEVAQQFGLAPGASVLLDTEGDVLSLRRPATRLAKLYIEPTSRCNLTCRTCIRNAWDEPIGHMTSATFGRILEGLRAFSPPPDVFFGGYGEPLAHPDIVGMVAQAAALGGAVELITNGMLLTPQVSRGLIKAGLSRLWISLDGATAESYGDVRLPGAEPDGTWARLLDNLVSFRDSRTRGHLARPEIGVAFVAMRSNIAELPALLALGSHVGANRFLITNLLPHTAEMCNEILYERAMNHISYLPSRWVPHVSLPKMDVDETTGDTLYRVIRSDHNISLAGGNLGAANDRCPFIEAGAAAVGWNGNFSPCLPLLHSHTSFLNRRERHVRCYTVGNVDATGLADLWREPEHAAFRARVQAFTFSPCASCGGCERSLANTEDCFGNSFPTCGGCLWAQGIVRCP